MARSSLALALLLTWPAPLLAQPSPQEPTPLLAQEAVRFQYTAPAECPDAAVFTARVRERTPRGRLADPQELARTFDVKLAAEASGFSGEIAFLDDAGNKVSRRLHGEQCDAVVTSLALITALALDATLRPEEPPAPPAPEPPRPASPSPTPVRTMTASPPPRQAPTRSLSARVGVAAGDSVIDGARVGVLGQLDWRAGVALRLVAHYASAEHTDAEGRSAQLRLLGVETSVCPWRFAAKPFALAPCGALDLGSLRGQGVQSAKLTSPGNDTIVWAAVGAELRLVWEAASPVRVELHGGAAFPLVATHVFQFKNPTKDVYEVPRFSGSAGGALGVRF